MITVRSKDEERRLVATVAAAQLSRAGILLLKAQMADQGTQYAAYRIMEML